MKRLSHHLIALVAQLVDGNYYTSTTLSRVLHISRSTVLRLIQKLVHYGIHVHTLKGKGYRLNEPLILLNRELIKNELFDKKCVIDAFESLDSTNDYLKKFRQKANKICLTEHQAKGKGRLQRHWHSPFAQNVYLSYLYASQQNMISLAGLSLVVSLAIVKTLAFYSIQTLVKWPNDVIYDNKKLAGVLIELKQLANKNYNAIIGIGINVNMLNDANHSISQHWTSLRLITGQYINRNHLTVTLLNTLKNYLDTFAACGLASFLEEWKTVDVLMNQDITLRCIDQKIIGTAKGIDASGHLLLQLPNRSIHTFSSGEASIIKI